ncbi:MAG: hypothetical protein H0X43_13670 [Nitrosospira sp.]|nr:hypothetical protein [Nitrosospira sp.]
MIASDHEKALAWITTQGLKLPRRTPEVTVAPKSDRAGRGGSILHQLQEAVRKSLPINVPEADADVNLSRSAAAPATVATPAIVANVANVATPLRDRMDKIVDSLIYNFQDRFKPLKDIQKRAALVPEDEDAVQAEERYSGMVRSQIDDFETERRTPLIKAIHESGQTYEDVEDYLHGLHAHRRKGN